MHVQGTLSATKAMPPPREKRMGAKKVSSSAQADFKRRKFKVRSTGVARGAAVRALWRCDHSMHVAPAGGPHG